MQQSLISRKTTRLLVSVTALVCFVGWSVVSYIGVVFATDAMTPSSAGKAQRSKKMPPLPGRWRETGDMTTARANHTATLLPNGKVLVIGGGASVDSRRTAELFDLTANGGKGA